MSSIFVFFLSAVLLCLAAAVRNGIILQCFAYSVYGIQTNILLFLYLLLLGLLLSVTCYFIDN